MDVSKFKLAGMEAVGSSLKDVVDAPLSSGTVQSIRDVSRRSLQRLVDEGVVSSFDVTEVQTKHQSKGWLGRVADFFLWKTPLRHLYYKPFYVQVSLAEKLQLLWEHTGAFEDMSQERFDELVNSVAGVTVWEERYPEDPYSIMLMDFAVRPVLPVEHISLTVTSPERPNG
jgi:hypothetical protein